MSESRKKTERNAVLGACIEYVEQTQAYGVKDAVSALLLYIVLFVEFMFMGKVFVNRGANLTQPFIFTITGVFALSSILLVCLLCVVHKQKFNTVGLSKTHWFKSFKLGMLLFMIVFIWGLIRILFFHGTVKTDISLILMRIAYYMIFIGFMEEIVFRGYIGTRLYGFISNKKVSIIITGIMFSFMHVPFQAMITQVEPIEYLMANSINLFTILLMHIGFQYIYAKYNSIIAPTIFHFIWDYIQWLIS